MNYRRPIHTTLNNEAIRVLDRYVQEFGAQNLVIERALLGMDRMRHSGKLDPSSVDTNIKKIGTGVIGLDNLLLGGIPQGFFVIVTGPPGTGKTTITMQFILEGVKNHERCLFFTFEESTEQLIRNYAHFGWDIGKYIIDGFLEIIGPSVLKTEEIIEIVDIFKPQRIVFDSINVFSDAKGLRHSSGWRNLYRSMKIKNITSMAVTEKKHGLEVKKFDDYDFMGDGVIFMDNTITKDIDSFTTNLLAIKKMRAENIRINPIPFKITERGIELFREKNK